MSPKPWRFSLPTENGEAVTDENGDNVYEYVEVPQEEKGFFGKLFGSFTHNKDDAEGTDNTYAENGSQGEAVQDKAEDSVYSTGNTVREPSAAIRGAAKPKRTLQIILRRHRRG